MPKPAYLLRQSTADDAPALQQLWRASFAEDREGPFVEWYFNQRFQPQNCWLLTTPQGGIAAMCHAPLVNIQQPESRKLAVPYIQGVATAAAHQGRGLCHRLLTAVEAELTRQGFPFCLLKPSDPAFYEPQGYRFCTYLRQYNIDLNQHFLEHLPAYEPDFTCSITKSRPKRQKRRRKFIGFGAASRAAQLLLQTASRLILPGF